MPRNLAAAIAHQLLLNVPDPASFSPSLKAGQPQESEPLGQTNTCQYKRLREMEQEGPDLPIYVIFFFFYSNTGCFRDSLLTCPSSERLWCLAQQVVWLWWGPLVVVLEQVGCMVN